MSDAGAVHAEYTARCDAANARAAAWGRRERWLSNARLLVFLTGLGIGFAAFGTRSVSALWVAVPGVAFIVLLVLHDRAIRQREKSDRAVAFYQAGLGRMEDRWSGTGETGEPYREDDHPYADDLDLFGDGSLFQLLCTARTPAGEETLASWLQAQPDAETARARQTAVVELRPRLELRVDLALLGETLRSRLAPAALITWGNAPVDPFPSAARPAAFALSSLTVVGLGLWIFSEAGAVPFLGALLLQSAFALWLRARIRPVIQRAHGPTRDLALLRGVLTRLEEEPFESPRLAALRALLDTDGHPPSERISRLQRMVDLLDARGNQFFAPIGALLLWGTHLGIAIEAWRAQCGEALGPWLEAVGEIEALCCLAGYAYEHPDDPFPEIVDTGPVLEGRGLGHPLLPRESCVRNDLVLGREPQAYVMSGSNMSGKSTMLRTVGCNTLLALTGAPIRGESLRLSPVTIAASIQVSDSLQTGTSHFYAEIKRLRQVVDATEGPRPVLFLLDEILHGTNSHDRRIGAAAVLRGLIERGAIGIVTTHDLALAKIADELAPRMRNVHFADHMEDGVMAFDYRLREGVVTRSNAIALMRSVGLEV